VQKKIKHGKIPLVIKSRKRKPISTINSADARTAESNGNRDFREGQLNRSDAEKLPAETQPG
jgi:hypothetical protein